MVGPDKPSAEEPRRSPQGELALKLHLLLDAVVAETGRPLTFRDISEAMIARGVKLSRSRWSYMKDGNGRLVQDRPLLAALSDFFKVDPDYLLGVEDVETPEPLTLQLELGKALRAARVKSFATRTLGDVSAETLQSITEFLERDIALESGGAAATDSGDSPCEPPVVP